MKPSKKVLATSVAAGSFAALVVSNVLPFTKEWEGLDLVAKRDPIGTGHPLTYCYGETQADGPARAGQHFTPAQCDAKLASSLPIYLKPLQACIKPAVPVKVMAATLDAAYNAGTAAVCKSPMVARMNAGDMTGACDAFYTKNARGQPTGWYIRASGRVVKGLINRRAAEKKLCFQGVAEGLPKAAPMPWWQHWSRLILFKS